MKTTIKTMITGYLLLLALFISTSSFAQVPQKFNYQGIARDAKGNPLSKQTLGLKISVLPTADASTPEYVETQAVITNEFGLYTLQIGNGISLSGEMKSVKWETGNKYIQVAIDPQGGTDYTVIGTSQLLSVPYAIYADKAGQATNTGDAGKTRALDNYIEKTTTIAGVNQTSLLYDNGVNIGLGTISPQANFHIADPASNTATTEIRIQHPNLVNNAARLSFFNDASTTFSTTADYAVLNKYAKNKTGLYCPGYQNGDLFMFANSQGNLMMTTGGRRNASGTLLDGLIGFGRFDQASSTNTTFMNIDLKNHNVAIGNDFTTPDPSAKLDIQGRIKIQGGSPSSGAVLTTNSGTGLAEWTNASTLIVGSAANDWHLNGNNITSTPGAFLGTTSAHPLQFKVNSNHAGDIDETKENAFYGYRAGENNFTTAGNKNTGIGDFALRINTTGFENTAVGRNTLANNVSNKWNTAIGSGALENNTADANTAVGIAALRSNTTGGYNTAQGVFALLSNTIGNMNTAVGQNVMQQNTIGSNNTALGGGAMFNNIAGSDNTAVGMEALYYNTSGTKNTVVGSKSLYNSSGNYNSALGAEVLQAVGNTGAYNNAIGWKSMFANTTGSANEAHGVQSLHKNTTGSNNIAIGHNAQYNNTTGSKNTAVGYEAMYTGAVAANTSHTNCTALGSNTKFTNPSTAMTYSTAIGANAEVSQDNSIVIGRTATNVQDKVGINTTAPHSALQVVGSFATTIKTISTAVVINATIDDYTFNCSASATIQLPPAINCKGRIYVVRRTSASVFPTIAPAAFTTDMVEQPIGYGLSTLPVGFTGSTLVSVTYQSDGSNWIKIATAN